MEHAFYKGFTLGILGGGQLGRMLIQPCINYNIQTAVLDPDPEAPCRMACSRFVQGSFRDYETVLKFGRTVDMLTIEIEHVNTDALFQLKSEGLKIYPQPEIIKMVQDKGLQKQFYRDNNIPTSDFLLLESEDEISSNLDFLPAFQKSRTAGYDGRGVKQIDTRQDIEDALTGPCVLEKKVDYRKEIAVIAARNSKGETTVFPAVEMVFHPEKNLLDYLRSPADLENGVEDQAREIALDIIKKLEMTGVLAVEMFVTHENEILVNEIAPRPHNSGHHTIEANVTSQYEQHLRAILGMPLGATDILYPSLLLNLLGEDGFEGEAKYEGLEDVLRLPGVYIHLYGKAITKPFRKMGHATVTGKTWDEVMKKAEAVKQNLKIKA